MRKYISYSSAQQFMLILTIFLYPLSLVGHTLYLIPQIFIIILSFMKGQVSLNIYKINIILFGILSFFISVFVEFYSISPSYDLPVKLLVNVLTIIVIVVDKSFSVRDNILSQLRYVAFIWLLILFCLYIIQGTSSIYIVINTLMAGDDLGSYQLYTAAEPIEKVFLTKNISSMFMVAVFAIYLYFSINFKVKVDSKLVLMFFLLTLMFLSRQGLLAFFVIFLLYKYINFKKLGKLAVFFSGFLLILFIFNKLFNLSNERDGASQRIELWRYFFEHYEKFIFFGMGQNSMSSILYSNVGIDNFHMFFMNQIGAYGIFHFISFNVFLFLVYNYCGGKGKFLLFSAYFLNVLFQTFGYEYGNLILFMIIFISFKSDFSDVNINKEAKSAQVF